VKILLASLVVGLLVALGYAGVPQFDDNAAWREACRLSRHSCFNLSRPAVVYAPIGALLGRYKMGDRYILINEKTEGSLRYAVKVHEMTHYIQWKRKKWTGTRANMCANEREAFDASNAVLRRLGETVGVVEWEKIRVAYGCSV
jgi:hypothetical protein